eukprot:11217105-Lingulodinium_polyedra.AAC.1
MPILWAAYKFVGDGEGPSWRFPPEVKAELAVPAASCPGLLQSGPSSGASGVLLRRLRGGLRAPRYGGRCPQSLGGRRS